MRPNVKETILGLFESAETVQSARAAKALGLTRQSAHRYLKMLVDSGELVAEGSGRGAHYRLAEPSTARFSFQTSGLEEDAVWEELSTSVEPIVTLSGDARDILQYALTELVNNAIDHSGAPTVDLIIGSVDVDAERRLTLDVVDGGSGVFRHVRDRLGLANELEALQDISKGKTSTMPERHSGEGLFFTSKAVDLFELESGTLTWIVDNHRRDMAVADLDPARDGTLVHVEIARDTRRSLDRVFAAHTESEESFEFSRSTTVIKLFTIGVRFVSRSEGKRLCHGLDRFREVILDFKGVTGVGQGFADEVFRVWARTHSDVALIPINMSRAVTFMVERARAGTR